MILEMEALTHLTYERRGPVARIGINRPDRLNSLVLPETRIQLSRLLTELEGEQELRALILTGEGDRAFSTGWDMSSIGDFTLSELVDVIHDNLALFFQIWNLRQPIIAAINGYALCAGAIIALVCDLAIAAENARLGEPEIRHYALSPLPLLPFFTHSKALHEYYYTGDMLDAAAMERLGLVNRVVPLAELEASAWKLAERLAKVPPHPLQMTKRSLRLTYETMGFNAAMRQHALADVLVIGGDLPAQKALYELLEKEGMRAFLDARDGPFREG